MFSEFEEKVREGLSGNLPGHEAHLEMAVIGHHGRRQPPVNASHAAVMALFVPGEKAGMELVFIKRSTQYQDDRHKGQIGFPGGKREPEDIDILRTALRETEEEIGVSSDSINVLGNLSHLYIPVSNFLVYPFVGVIETRPEFTLQTAEINEIITFPLSRLLSKESRKRTRIQISSGIHLENVPYFDLRGKILWGATAMMTAELIRVIDCCGFKKSIFLRREFRKE
ncbi:MAG: CoA pyrophosphatase [Saprospirales bacterium]|nr:MAG: CoA pyrophosphatase [Saprospirales bacterium]